MILALILIANLHAADLVENRTKVKANDIAIANVMGPKKRTYQFGDIVAKYKNITAKSFDSGFLCREKDMGFRIEFANKTLEYRQEANNKVTTTKCTSPSAAKAAAKILSHIDICVWAGTPVEKCPEPLIWDHGGGCLVSQDNQEFKLESNEPPIWAGCHSRIALCDESVVRELKEFVIKLRKARPSDSKCE